MAPKSAVFAPIPSARDRTTTVVNPWPGAACGGLDGDLGSFFTLRWGPPQRCQLAALGR
jgi:hypothetical protein